MLSAFSANQVFFKECYLPLADIMDGLALINSTINFVIYYFMSRQFRKTFIEMFGFARCCPQLCNRCDRNSNNNDAETQETTRRGWTFFGGSLALVIPRRFRRGSHTNVGHTEMTRIGKKTHFEDTADNSAVRQSQNTTHKIGYRNAAAAGIDENAYITASPHEKKPFINKQAIVIENPKTATVSTYVTSHVAENPNTAAVIEATNDKTNSIQTSIAGEVAQTQQGIAPVNLNSYLVTDKYISKSNH